MQNNKQIAVWLDYSKASFISADPSNKNIQTIYSEYNFAPGKNGTSEDGYHRDGEHNQKEYRSNKKEIDQLNDYYNNIEKVLEKYDDILLFGPTKAKNELYNRLSENKKFATKTIDVESADKMTENQLFAFVREYFTINKN